MRIRNMALAGLAGAAVAYLFDPVSGGARRDRLRAGVATLIPSQVTRRDRTSPLPDNVAPATATPAVTRAAAPPARAGSSTEGLDDGAIAQTIRMRLRERADLQAGDLVIDVVRGVAYLRGDLHDPQKMDELVDLTGSVPGVRRVQSLLHLPEGETISPQETKPLGDAWNG